MDAADDRLAEGFVSAIEWIRQRRAGESALPDYAEEILVHAEQHLLTRFRRWRQGPRITGEAEAVAFMKGCAQELDAASRALLEAAAHLKHAHKGTQANQAFLAGRRAAQAAEGMR